MIAPGSPRRRPSPSRTGRAKLSRRPPTTDAADRAPLDLKANASTTGSKIRARSAITAAPRRCSADRVMSVATAASPNTAHPASHRRMKREPVARRVPRAERGGSKHGRRREEQKSNLGRRERPIPASVPDPNNRRRYDEQPAERPAAFSHCLVQRLGAEPESDRRPDRQQPHDHTHKSQLRDDRCPQRATRAQLIPPCAAGRTPRYRTRRLRRSRPTGPSPEGSG